MLSSTLGTYKTESSFLCILFYNFNADLFIELEAFCCEKWHFGTKEYSVVPQDCFQSIFNGQNGLLRNQRFDRFISAGIIK